MHKEKKAVRTERAVEDIKAIIRDHYPEAEFEVTRRPHLTEGIWLLTYVDAEDPEDAISLTGDRLADILVNEGISIHVIPMPFDRRPSVRAGQTAQRQSA